MRHTKIPLLDEPLLGMRMDFLPQRFQFEQKCTVTISSWQEWQQKRDSLPGHGDVWYTDGSKSKERSGSGYYSCRHDKGLCMSLGVVCDHFSYRGHGTTELCLEGLNAVGRGISIYSDSQVALRVLAVLATHSWFVGECKEALRRMPWQSETGSDSFGYRDMLGSEATRQPTGSHLKVRAKRQRDQNHLWGLLIITGHGNLSYHLHKMELSAEGGCRWCGDGSETALHLLTTCPAWLRTRIKWFGMYELGPHQELQGWQQTRLLEAGRFAITRYKENAGTMDFESTCRRLELLFKSYLI